MHRGPKSTLRFVLKAGILQFPILEKMSWVSLSTYQDTKYKEYKKKLLPLGFKNIYMYYVGNSSGGPWKSVSSPPKL
jgi:hypothetical protein